MRFLVLLAGALLAIAAPARAGLIGAGHTVDAQFYLGDHIAADLEDESGGAVALTAPLSFPAHALDLSTISITDTQITITSESDFPYCSTGNVPCTDGFTGFEFLFSGGVDITGVTVDASSAATMIPLNIATLLLSPTDILVNLTGDSPAVGDKLVLDLNFGVVTTSVPEPASLLVFGSALLGLGFRRGLKRNR